MGVLVAGLQAVVRHALSGGGAIKVDDRLREAGGLVGDHLIAAWGGFDRCGSADEQHQAIERACAVRGPRILRTEVLDAGGDESGVVAADESRSRSRRFSVFIVEASR